MSRAWARPGDMSMVVHVPWRTSAAGSEPRTNGQFAACQRSSEVTLIDPTPHAEQPRSNLSCALATTSRYVQDLVATPGQQQVHSEYLITQSALAARLNAYRSIRSVCRAWPAQQQPLQRLQATREKNSGVRILAGITDVTLMKFLTDGFGEDLAGGLGPGEWLAAVVPPAGEPADGGDPVHPVTRSMPALDAGGN